MSYTIHQAKTNLSRLIKEAQKGKEVIIARGKQPVAKLVPISSGTKKRTPGRLKGLFRGSLELLHFSPTRNCKSGVCNDRASRHSRFAVVVGKPPAAFGNSTENNRKPLERDPDIRRSGLGSFH